ncbi:TRAP transporter permease [Magnetospira sp. QH-2]|uniref:TRAP transporter permease n=1 Tax=Magnetospira sp. (strain QH-2) TaxID=1288970 RepID=UPI0003E80C0D|nr:TRAP transporter permease [Magnetospira sp. QH-2]CCQ73636.1 Putative TRAP transporter, 4TM/12TM fusion protein [Magnetospira sp. QH-2]
MSATDTDTVAPNGVNAEDLVAESDTGARDPYGLPGKMLIWVPLTWSLFQLYISSTVPFWLTRITGINLTFNSDEARAIHLAFALFLAATAFPLFRTSPRHHIPWYDWLLAFVGVAACLYMPVFKEEISQRPGLWTMNDLIISGTGLAILLISTYRALGLPLVVVASVFMFYVFFGHLEALPDVLRWKGASFTKALGHYWMQTEGVFGVALGVSASMIFLFVLFGSILEKAGAGAWFIKTSVAMLGHFRGGPAKAAVLSSAMTGLISGSSIANTVTTGTFTIPLMKRTGFPAEKAGAVEVASSTNGQLTPPVMGAAAFLMIEYVGVTYLEVVRHAFLPALISYIALLYIVHLESLKLGLKGLPRGGVLKSIPARIANVVLGFLIVAGLGGAIYYGLGWTKEVFGEGTIYVAMLMFLVAYVALAAVAARLPDLDPDELSKPMLETPVLGPTVQTGLYYLLPIVVLVWCLMIERFSPGLSAFWATMGMIFITLTQDSLKGVLRKQSDILGGLRSGLQHLKDGMVAGARNMIGIAVATGAAGIIVGTISLTGAHQIMGEFVEFLSGGNLMLMLFLVAVLSLILGMGLPTTANYIVVSSLMAPVIIAVGAKSGLIVPLIAVHMFVFYFGILADDTPPVGLAAFAASAISGGDPIRTGIQGFMYDIRTGILPFLFIFNTDLLLINVSPGHAIIVFLVALVAMLTFASATQGYFLVRNRLWESALMLLVAFTMFRPGFWLDQVHPPFVEYPGTEIVQVAGTLPENGEIRFVIEGPDSRNGEPDGTTLVAPLGASGDGEGRLMTAAGLMLRMEDGKAILEEPMPNSPLFQKMLAFDFYGDDPVHVVRVEVPAERIAKEYFYIPAAIVLILLVVLQRRRQRTEAPV